MTIYAIAQGRIDDREQFNKYIVLAGPTLEAHNAKLIALDETPTVIEGSLDYPRTVIVQFESKEHFLRWYDSPEYKQARKQREGALVGRFFVVEAI